MITVNELLTLAIEAHGGAGRWVVALSRPVIGTSGEAV